MQIEVSNFDLQTINIEASETLFDLVIKKGVTARLIVSYANSECKSNIILEEGSKLELLMKKAGQVIDLTQDIKVNKDAQLELAYWELDEASSKVNTHIDLLASGANAHVLNVCIAQDKKDYFLEIKHHAPYTKAKMDNFALIKDGGKYYMEAIGNITKGAYASESHQSTRVLTLTSNHHTNVLPVLLIDENDVKASHASTLGQPDENQLYYLQTRGLKREDALSLLTIGYLMPITNFFEDEAYQAQAKDEIEKKVGLHA